MDKKNGKKKADISYAYRKEEKVEDHEVVDDVESILDAPMDEE